MRSSITAHHRRTPCSVRRALANAVISGRRRQIASAINDAIRPLGISINTLPLNVSKLGDLIAEARAHKYFDLGRGAQGRHRGELCTARAGRRRDQVPRRELRGRGLVESVPYATALREGKPPMSSCSVRAIRATARPRSRARGDWLSIGSPAGSRTPSAGLSAPTRTATTLRLRRSHFRT